MIYNKDSFTLKDIEKMLQTLWTELKPTERTLKLYISGDNIEYMNALLSGDKNRIEVISKKISEQVAISQEKYKDQFITWYDSDLYEFMCSIMPKNWLKGDHYYFIDNWSYICEEEYADYNDDTYILYFSKGKFNVRLDIAGGYAGSEMKEENISRERVLEIIKTHPQL